MKVLVTGAGGMLGQDVVTLFRQRGHEVTAATRADLDVLDTRALAQVVPGHDAVINCAAYTAVDAAETDHEAAADLNAVAPGYIGSACAKAGARMVQVSTDYVFAGDATTPYAEDAPVAPKSVYGRTKADGERTARRAHKDTLVVRTAWLYGAGGPCFPKTIVKLARERGAVSVVDDQIGQPTWTMDVARVIADLLEASAPAGTYHATSSGSTSWYGFTREVVQAAGLDRDVVSATTSAAFVRPAPRPAWSVLAHRTLKDVGVTPIASWNHRWAAAAPTVVPA